MIDFLSSIALFFATLALTIVAIGMCGALLWLIIIGIKEAIRSFKE